MLVPRTTLLSTFNEKPVHVKARTRENESVDMTVNRIIVLLVFASGVAVAVIGTLLSQYIRESFKELPGKWTYLACPI